MAVAERGPAGDSDVGLATAVNAAWVWVPEDRPLDPAAAARFARAQGVRTAWVSVPWLGPSPVVREVAGALRAEGLAVCALGGSEDWARHPDRVIAWARRAVAEPVFTGVHLDIEPWTAPDWPAHGDLLLARVGRAAEQVALETGLAVEIDLSPRLAVTHPRGFEAAARGAGSVTVMSYRTSAEQILSFSAAAIRTLTAMGRTYRLSVDTLPNADPDATFAGKHPAYLDRVVAEVAGRLSGDPHFVGFAVHDLWGWRDLPTGQRP